MCVYVSNKNTKYFAEEFSAINDVSHETEFSGTLSA